MTGKTEQSARVIYLDIGPEGATADVLHPAFDGWVVRVRLSEDGAVESFTMQPPRQIGPPGSDAREPAPAGGVTTTLLRRIPLGEVVAAVRARIAATAKRDQERADRFDESWFAKEHPDLRDFYNKLAARGRLLSERPGRAGRSDVEYALVAAAYVDLVATDPTPLATLAKRMYRSESQLRNILYAARRRGLLTEALKGRAGGRLTPKAIALLEGGTDGER
jgi:hypothetical protein